MYNITGSAETDNQSIENSSQSQKKSNNVFPGNIKFIKASREHRKEWIIANQLRYQWGFSSPVKRKQDVAWTENKGSGIKNLQLYWKKSKNPPGDLWFNYFQIIQSSQEDKRDTPSTLVILDNITAQSSSIIEPAQISWIISLYDKDFGETNKLNLGRRTV